jgi:Ca2+-binding EF-hand superfamily protein
MKTFALAAAAAAVAALSAPAIAQPANPPAGASAQSMFPLTRASAQQRMTERFGTRDANHDGFLMGEELGPNAAMALERLDADHDGKISLAEANQRTLADFDRADADHDGTVTEAEASTMMGPPPAQPQPH